MRACLAALLLLASPAFAQDAEEDPAAATSDPRDELPDVPTPPRTGRIRLPDLTAEVLVPNEGQFNLFYLQYSRGILPGLQLSTHFGGWLVTLVNLTAEYQFLDLPELRASIEGGAYWFALSRLVQATLLQGHVTPRATVPLTQDLDLNLALNARWLVVTVPGLALNNRDVTFEATAIRYDEGGAWILQARCPLLTSQSQHFDQLLGQPNVSGTILLDDLGSWGIVASRDFSLGETAHVRLGLGYRNRPGLLMVDSLGNFILQLDAYWR